MNIHNIQTELIKLDLQTVIEEMDNYATLKLKDVDIKQFEGLTPADFTQITIFKVLDNTYNWADSSTSDAKKFLFGCLRIECNKFLRKLKGYNHKFETYEDNDNYNDENN